MMTNEQWHEYIKKNIKTLRVRKPNLKKAIKWNSDIATYYLNGSIYMEYTTGIDKWFFIKLDNYLIDMIFHKQEVLYFQGSFLKDFGNWYYKCKFNEVINK